MGSTKLKQVKQYKTYFWTYLCFCLCLTACEKGKSTDQTEIIHSVNGSIELEQLGLTLTHEHIMSNFGAEIEKASEYDEDALLKQVIPYLKKSRSLGVQTIVDCTTAFFGRRIDLLKKIADSTGIQIITNTGFYGAANDRYIPAFAFEASAEELSAIWVDEFENGIEGTDIKPGFIKLAFDEGAPSEIDRKLFIAGILTHKQTGLSLAVHTGNNLAAAEIQMELLEQNQVGLDAWIWTHANLSENTDMLINAAKKGAWISLDGVKSSNVSEYVEKLKLFRTQNLLHKVLLSHDGNGFPRGGEIRPFQALLTDLIPTLLESGFTQNEVDLMTLENPKKAFGIKSR